MLVPNYFENLQVLHENTMPSRAYYIPASKPMDDLVEHRELSDRFQLLNGNWLFRYFESIYDVKEEFFRTDFEAGAYDSVSVPAVWQSYGCDVHQYTNYRYPFPADPPYVPLENPCGAYLCDFRYRKEPDAPKTFLIFEGVDSCFYLWLNGQYVGYSQISHAVHEFDVTKYIREGSNRLAVLVLKWCDGSYLEDQDKFRMSGIFRDVYLLKRPENVLFDYFVRTNLYQGEAELDISVYGLEKPLPVTALLYDPEGNLVGKDTSKERIRMPVPDVKLWNSEEPWLYRLVLETDGETITDHVGFREIHTEGNVLYINGKPVKLRGVNRHESDPVTGYVIRPEHMKRDLEMIRRHNFNAIRTSHYPNIPYFYELCDRYGFYVIDEADNESHGPWQLYYAGGTDKERAERWNEMISDNPAFDVPVLDRTIHLVEQDKNRPCVIIWSMGNECGYGCTFEKALRWTKSYDPSRLTHYESAYYRGTKRKYDYSCIDLYSRMYPQFSEVIDYAESNPDKPFLMCEYAHSMGNGPGDFEDYYELIETYDCICGAFVWEWCDHAIYAGTAPDGRKKYLYGGDHGELLHDGNFCMDGLVYPDRTPHTGLLEYKNVHRPGRVTSFDPQTRTLTIRNELNFRDLLEYADLSWELTCDGRMIAEGPLENPAVPVIEPHKCTDFHWNQHIPEKGKCFLRILYRMKAVDPLIPAGHLLGFDEIPLKNTDGRNQDAIRWEREADRADTSEETPIHVKEEGRNLILSGVTFSYTFDTGTGLFTSLCFAGRELLKKPMQISIWRAPTDNDIQIKKEWMNAFYDHTASRAYRTLWKETKEGISISCVMSLLAASVQKILEINTIWTVGRSGSIHMQMQVQRQAEFPELPRFGIRMMLDDALEDVTYCGLGPYESYRDKRRASHYGIFTAKVAKLHEDYLRPQENGSHDGCDYIIIRDSRTALTVLSPDGFSFNASPYTQEELTVKRHNFELEPSGASVLNLDYRQDGIGSNSCGPRPKEKYRFDEERFTFRLRIIPSSET